MKDKAKIKFDFSTYRSAAESGVTMLELSLSLLVLLAIIGLTFQLGIIFYRYAALRYTANFVTRSMVRDVGSARCASTLTEATQARIDEVAQGSLGFKPDDYEAIAQTEAAGSNCALFVTLKSNVPCIFCGLNNFSVPIHVSRGQVVGDECFSCNC